MKKVLRMAALAMALAVAPASRAGSISGTVHAEGKPGTDEYSSEGAYSSKALKNAERVDYDEMHDFIVYIEGPVPGAKLLRPHEKIVQKNATFVPHLLPIMVGTTVEFPNDDNIFHNVFSKSDAMPFDLGLYKKGEADHSVTFTNVGQVDVFCSIHARMNCVILVRDNPYFAVTDGRGRYTIPDVPPGTYKLVAWQERLPKDVKQITVPESGPTVRADFTLGPKNLPKY